MKNQYYLFLFLLCALYGPVKGQSISAFDLYPYNFSLINPAYTGSEGTHKFSALGRGNNLGDEFSSTSWMLGYEASIKSIHSGVGFMYTRDNIGPYRNGRYSLTYSYTFTLPDSSQFRLGTNLSLDRLVLDYSDFRMLDPNDLLLNTGSKVSDQHPIVGVGVWYNRQKLFAGFSVDYLNQPTFRLNETFPLTYTIDRKYHITLGYKDLQWGGAFTSTHSLNYTRPAQNWYFTDWNNTVAYKDLLFLGLGYRLPKEGFEQGSFRMNGGVWIARRVQLMSLIYVQKHKNVRSSGLSGELLLKVTL
jgi:type IX secretion system PorP/SprF family membrane protein